VDFSEDPVLIQVSAYLKAHPKGPACATADSRANSASAVDLPVPDIPVIRTRVISSKLSRPPQADLSRSGSGSSEATSKHAAGIPLRGLLVAQCPYRNVGSCCDLLPNTLSRPAGVSRRRFALAASYQDGRLVDLIEHPPTSWIDIAPVVSTRTPLTKGFFDKDGCWRVMGGRVRRGRGSAG
jgi:hypothetical protein